MTRLDFRICIGQHKADDNIVQRAHGGKEVVRLRLLQMHHSRPYALCPKAGAGYRWITAGMPVIWCPIRISASTIHVLGSSSTSKRKCRRMRALSWNVRPIFDAASGVCRLLTLLVEALRHDVLVPAKLHRDAIPVPMLALSKGSAKTRRLWAEYAITGRQGSVQPLWFGSLTRQTAKASIQAWSQAQSAWPEPEWL